MPTKVIRLRSRREKSRMGMGSLKHGRKPVCAMGTALWSRDEGQAESGAVQEKAVEVEGGEAESGVVQGGEDGGGERLPKRRTNVTKKELKGAKLKEEGKSPY